MSASLGTLRWTIAALRCAAPCRAPQLCSTNSGDLEGARRQLRDACQAGEARKALVLVMAYGGYAMTDANTNANVILQPSGGKGVRLSTACSTQC